ncbi:VOC family protein [Actinokineospora sp. G85]|uniref:VOC family protein n=1 Tax=Actinokineospora sp. G85 TaxID=3406626 RepID=UPI003C747E9B
MPALTGAHHVALTVTDVDRSVPWYERVLGFTAQDWDDEGDLAARKVVLNGFGMTLTLVQHPGVQRQSFDECRPGLDHLSLPVASAAELTTWAESLTALGVPFGHTPGAANLSLRDPDGIQLVLAAPLGTRPHAESVSDSS